MEIMICIIVGHLHLVKYLIEARHMNINVQDGKTKFTGLQLATVNDRFQVIAYLLSFYSLSLIKQNDRSQLNPSRVSSAKCLTEQSPLKLCEQNLKSLENYLSEKFVQF